MNRPRLVIAAAVLAAAGVVAGVAAAGRDPAKPPAAAAGPSAATATPSGEPVRVVIPGRPGEPAAVSDDGRVRPPADPPANAIDAAFVQMMIPHHEQALRMAALADGRAGDARVAAVAERIRLAQAAEIPQLRAWLAAHGLPAAPAGHDHATMPGMQPAAELDRLAAATGADFDRRFVAMMSAHHSGALRMVQDALAGGADQRVAELANEIGVEQAAEINRLAALL